MLGLQAVRLGPVRAVVLVVALALTSCRDVVPSERAEALIDSERAKPQQILFSGWCGVGMLTGFRVTEYATVDGKPPSAGSMPMADYRGPVGIANIQVEHWMYNDDPELKSRELLGVMEGYDPQTRGDLHGQVGRRGIFVFRVTRLIPTNNGTPIPTVGDGILRQRLQLARDLATLEQVRDTFGVTGGLFFWWFPETEPDVFGPIVGQMYTVSDVERLLSSLR